MTLVAFIFNLDLKQLIMRVYVTTSGLCYDLWFNEHDDTKNNGWAHTYRLSV